MAGGKEGEGEKEERGGGASSSSSSSHLTAHSGGGGWLFVSVLPERHHPLLRPTLNGREGRGWGGTGGGLFSCQQVMNLLIERL